jgi:hypothetical protein
MSDATLLITGIAVFGLMVIAVVLTVLEFRSIEQRHRKRE